MNTQVIDGFFRTWKSFHIVLAMEKAFVAITFLLLHSKLHLQVFGEDSEGQKAHFQVEDKSGDLNIQATKDEAKVTAQADSVDVVVKPGTAEYPILKSDKPMVHIKHPVNGGFGTIEVKKKSSILNQKRRGHGKSEQENKQKVFSNLFRKRSKLRNLFKKSTIQKHFRKTELSRLHKTENKLRKTISNMKNTNLQRRKAKNAGHDDGSFSSASRKSEIKNESGFKVSGDAGKLKMKVTKDETQLESNSGTVDITLKHPAHSQSTAAASDSSPQAKHMVHLAPELEGEWTDSVGLKKSKVTPVRH